MIYFSLCRLVRRSGEPRWKSERKKIFLPSAICMGKYNSWSFYQENINFFWPVHAHYQGLFNIGRAAGTGRHGDKRRHFVFIFLRENIQALKDIIKKMIGPGYADVDRSIYADQSAAFLSGTHENTSRSGYQCFASGN